MLNTTDQEMLAGMRDESIPERKNFAKREGWYTLQFETIEEEDNVDDTENIFSQFNAKMRILNGPSKGVEFFRFGIPAKGHASYQAKTYDNSGNEVLDPDGDSIYRFETNEDGSERK